jgi:hypothetical protein
MRTVFVAAAVFSALIGATIDSSMVLAQQKTVRACRDEWRANKEENQRNGITEKAFVDKCRAGVATTSAPATRGAANPVEPAPAPAPAAAPAPPPAAAPARPSRTLAARPAPTTTAAPTGANQFPAEVQARARCPSDTVVWANTSSRIYHFAGTKSYGTTKAGAYMCEQDARAEGIRAAKNEKHP